jgi:DNA-binding winged helix-turn-helix (wHTH) protein
LLEGDAPVSLGSRALDLLIALVERPGELISKPELIEKVWPHTFVVEGNLKLHIAALRRALGDGQCSNRYISTVCGRGYCFVAPVTRSVGPRSATAQYSAMEPLSNFPAPLMRLIGRDEVISRISEQLVHHRLITLVGPGGIGKTSVAVATAERLTDSYEHGVWFIDLTAISDSRLLAAAVGSTLRLDVSVEDPFASLLSFLSDKRMLLVLDNCEHVIEGAAAALAFQVSRAASGVQILATSREPLGVEGERLHRLQSLEVPAVSPGLSAQQALDFPAVQLFVERAANLPGDFTLRDVDVPVVVGICRKLDGVPLAIELAAASIDALGLQGIIARLDHPLRLPGTRRRIAAPRHRTLRAALEAIVC